MILLAKATLFAMVGIVEFRAVQATRMRWRRR
jgi:hypothetical protein